jgi:hypothetical protein
MSKTSLPLHLGRRPLCTAVLGGFVAISSPAIGLAGGAQGNPCAMRRPVQLAAACNPCAARKASACNPCNPCAAKKLNPCNPCEEAEPLQPL